MQCDICFRTGGQKLAFLCATDARNQLYEPRIQIAKVLLEKDGLDRQISALLSPQLRDKEQNEQTPVIVASREEVVGVLAEKDHAVDRTKQIIANADELRETVRRAREDIAKRKAVLARRKSELASASNGAAARRTRQIEEMEKVIRMTKYKWNQAHTVTASSRTFLCSEAAKLYGLRRVKKSGGVEEYRIGGIGIIDLRFMNTASPAHISTSLSHIVHLLMLSTHYLAIRLPAEITLPHRDYPLPTILPLASSHIFTNIPFPGSTPGHSSNNSPSASRHAEVSTLPRPRPLFISKPLPLLASEDPATYSLFLEGVTLLAYNVAWVCKSQGIPVGESCSFEDICNIGRNCFNLLLGSQARTSPPNRVPSAQSTPTKGGGRESEAESEDKQAAPGTIMGRYSHGTTHSFLGGADGTEFMRSWRVLSPTKLADRLKAKLMSEVANAEWEVLDQDAWAVENELGEDGVVVGARREGERRPGLGIQSFMSMRTVMDVVEMVGGDGDRKPGTSGWTKLKPR